MNWKLKITWISKKWEEWNTLQESEEFKQIITHCNDILQKAQQAKGTGKGAKQIQRLR